jgi:hypothetical protein
MWLGGSQGRSGRVRKISPLPGFDPRTVQPVASRLLIKAYIRLMTESLYPGISNGLGELFLEILFE